MKRKLTTLLVFALMFAILFAQSAFAANGNTSQTPPSETSTTDVNETNATDEEETSVPTPVPEARVYSEKNGDETSYWAWTELNCFDGIVQSVEVLDDSTFACVFNDGTRVEKQLRNERKFRELEPGFFYGETGGVPLVLWFAVTKDKIKLPFLISEEEEDFAIPIETIEATHAELLPDLKIQINKKGDVTAKWKGKTVKGLKLKAVEVDGQKCLTTIALADIYVKIATPLR